MRSMQNERVALAQENQGDNTPCTTLQDEIDALTQHVQARANTMNKKRCTCNDRAQWIARGRQQALRRVTSRLLARGAAYVSRYTLYLALQKYLDCLDKYRIDASEKKHARGPRNGLPLARWQAEGKAHERGSLVPSPVLFRLVLLAACVTRCHWMAKLWCLCVAEVVLMEMCSSKQQASKGDDCDADDS